MTGPPQPLWSGAVRSTGARFTPTNAFDAIHLAGDPITGLAEVQSIVFLPGGPVPIRMEPLVILSVQGIVHNVLDLTAKATLAALGTSTQDVTGNWARHRNPPTQVLGRAAYHSGRIAGVRYGSARREDAVNIVVFPDRLPMASSDYLEVHDPHGNLTQRLGAGLAEI